MVFLLYKCNDCDTEDIKTAGAMFCSYCAREFTQDEYKGKVDIPVDSYKQRDINKKFREGEKDATS